MAIKDKSKVKHREELIGQIKMLGQEVIDRAEDFVCDAELRTSFEIRLIFSHDVPPEIEYTSTHVSKIFLDSNLI